MTDLSPAAQAVMDALYEGWHVATPGQCLAAALRAAVDQVVPEVWFESDDITEARDALLAIAAEMDNTNNTSEENFND
jgi:hypothetical protein